MRELKDVQGERSLYSIPISRVGVKNVKMPIVSQRDDEENHLVAEFDVFVDLPPNRKGADMSRAVEAINEVVLKREHLLSIEKVAQEIAKESLRRFDYSTLAIVSLKTELYSKKTSQSGKTSFVSYPMSTEAIVSRDGSQSSSIEVDVLGINACPCAMETAKTLIANENPEIDGFLDSVPGITHNQRNHVKIKAVLYEDKNIEAMILIEAAEKVLGGPILPVLKRVDEGNLVIHAHKNPMFVEDIARSVAMTVLNIKDFIPDNAFLEVSSESEESIHPHNAYAKISGNVGDLRKIADYKLNSR